MSHEFDFKAKDVSWRDTFYNSKKKNYTKVSFGETLSTIPQNPLCIKICGNDFKAKDVSLQCMKIVESVSSRDTFSINPIFLK